METKLVSESNQSNGEKIGKEQTKEAQQLATHCLQITTKFNFDHNRIFKINELSNQRIGVLLNNSLLIYNLKSFQILDEVKFPILDCNYDEGICDFIELKNTDLVLWSIKQILFYHLIENKYQLYQTINGLEEENKEKSIDYGFYSRSSKKGEINSIYELSTGKLILCISSGLAVFTKINEEYKLESKHEIKIDVRRAIEINENKLVLLQRYHYFFWGCSRNNFSSHTYLISTYDLETKQLTKLAENEVTKNDYYGYTSISYLIKNGFLLIRYGNRIDIYDIKNNMTLVNHDQDTMVKHEETYYGKYKLLKDDMDVIFLCEYFDDLILVKNFKVKDKAKIYMLKDNSISYVADFPYELKGLAEIIKLKNNCFIMYSENQLVVLNKK